MAFRADEAARALYQGVEDYFLPRRQKGNETAQAKAAALLREISQEIGPVIDTYPTWHPLVSQHDKHNFVVTPGQDCGYEGLDHTRFFRNGFITCPYGGEYNVNKILASVNEMHHPDAEVTAEVLEGVKLYSEEATPVLVKCVWKRKMNEDGTIPASVAVPLLLESELQCWRWAERTETWDTVRPYFLGTPRGSRSSLFVNQDDGQVIKKVWDTLISSGMFGSIKEK